MSKNWEKRLNECDSFPTLTDEEKHKILEALEFWEIGREKIGKLTIENMELTKKAEKCDEFKELIPWNGQRGADKIIELQKYKQFVESVKEPLLQELLKDVLDSLEKSYEQFDKPTYLKTQAKKKIDLLKQLIGGLK